MTMSTLRDFQGILAGEVYTAWNEGARDVMLTAPTGGGKTVIFSHILQDMDVPAAVIAHRQELVGQACLALNFNGVAHGIIAPKEIQQQIIALEMDTQGRTFYSPNSMIRVAGVDTVIRRDGKDPWYSRVQTIVQDEGHHVIRGNKWHRAHTMFPNARGLLVTAHAIRGDGKGLGRQSDGIVDRLVQGPSGRDLINRGYLCDYRLVCPPSDIDVSDVPITSVGDFSGAKLRDVVHASRTLVGDVVQHYLRFAAGKLGLTFAVDIETAQKIANAYNAAGVPAAIITADTPLNVRGSLMRQFRARQLLQLVSVDVLGEGTDVPAVEVVSLARHTASFQLFAQQIGRALRIMVSDELNAAWGVFTDLERLAHIAASVKPKALILDHVGNVARFYKAHGLPDSPQRYSLIRVVKKSRGESDGIPLRICLECLQPYEAFRDKCPYCGAAHVSMGRGAPAQVEGNLVELSPEALQALRGEIAHVDGPAYIPVCASQVVMNSIKKNHRERQDAQHELRAMMALYGGYQLHRGLTLSEAQRLFWYMFGIDVMSAQALGAPGAADLWTRIDGYLKTENVIAKIN
jgi:DNA repair protein RadD